MEEILIVQKENMEKKNLEMEVLSFHEKESLCENIFNQAGSFWHIFTPGELTEVLFITKEELMFAMNILGICADKFKKVRILTFEVMNNHLHLIVVAEEEEAREFFAFLRVRLSRYFSRNNRKVDLSKFEATFLKIADLKQLRNEIVYVNRNGFVVNSAYTPDTYPWGAGYLFFNRIYDYLNMKPYSSLKFREKRMICKSADINLSESLMVIDGVIMPSSFCYIREAESYFRDAHQYFNMLSKNYEAFSEIAKRLGDKVILNDQEMYSAVCSLCYKRFQVKKPNELSPTSKLEMAKIMHFDLGANNKQIVRILRLNTDLIEEMFPRAR